MPACSDYMAVAIGALVLIVVLAAGYMCIQLYSMREARRDGFHVQRDVFQPLYAPSCGAPWLGRSRRDCRGITSGAMPAIDSPCWPTGPGGPGIRGGGLCCGCTDIPP